MRAHHDRNGSGVVPDVVDGLVPNVAVREGSSSFLRPRARDARKSGDRRGCGLCGRRAGDQEANRGAARERFGPADLSAPRTWKVKDVAEFLQASESWVRHAAAAGRLPCKKIGGLLRFDAEEIRSLARGATPARVVP